MSTLRTDAILDSLGGNTTTINGILLNSGALDPGDRIINGDFGLWQRGTNFTTNAYSADRWTNTFIGGTVTQSRQTFPLGDTLGVNTPAYFLRQTVSGHSLASNAAIITQHIESVRSYAGQTITVLGWAKRSSGTGNMAINSGQYFGLGGTPSTSILTSGQTVTLTESWAPFAVAIDVPSITGKTLGTDGRDYLDINFWTSAGSNFAVSSNSLGPQTIGVDLWGIHIKLGIHAASTTSQYRPRDPGTELALCQRYYEAVNVTSAINGAYVNAVNFSVTKRATPTLTLIAGNLASGGFGVSQTGIGQNVNSTGASSVTFAADAEF